MWRDYFDDIDPFGHTVTGKLRVLPGLYSPQLGNQRDILVHLPPSHCEIPGKRYPVIYAQDGQNLFDRATSFIGEWEADETMQALERVLRLEAIIVGIPNAGFDRLNEYSPFRDDEYGGGRGDAYLDFVVNTVKPIIDRDFLTQPGRATTGILGSSMGGLISLYGFLKRNDVFGFCASMSPAYWFADKAILNYVQNASPRPGRIYLDSGTGEKSSPGPLGGIARCFCDDVQLVRDLLIEKGFRLDADVWYVQEINGVHSEATWARRLPLALRFLLTGDKP
jgi:predicted alpha/beta superfamily hydrolase